MLQNIPNPAALRALSESELPQLADELRAHLLKSLNLSGGHLASNLGIVELTLALHFVFDTPRDLLVFDTGHQAYIHKILTERREELQTIRTAGGPAPFPSREESHYDAFGVGHAGTALSAAMGLALGSIGSGDRIERQTVAVLGDGAFTTGMTWEALNHLAHTKIPVRIVLNDNGMSISPTVGGPQYSVGLLREIGISVYGPIDGHDLRGLIQSLRACREEPGPTLIHVRTQKGRGYLPAEQDPVRFHSVSPGFLTRPQSKQTGSGSNQSESRTFSQIFGEWLCKKALTNPELVVLTPAMAEGSGLAEFAKQFPARFHDVGIAEQHCMTFAAGLAAAGKKPVVAIYSTFLQRAYDQVVHDIAVQNLPVLIAIDRAGLAGPDGPTHHGIFDIGFLRAIPRMVVMAPADESEFTQMLSIGFERTGPVAIRYPKGTCPQAKSEQIVRFGRASVRRTGTTVAFLVFGPFVDYALSAASVFDGTVVSMGFVKPLDTDIIASLCATHELIVTLEDHMIAGGAGSAVNEFVVKLSHPKPVLNWGIPDTFINHGNAMELREQHAGDLVQSVQTALCRNAPNTAREHFQRLDTGAQTD